MSSALDIGGVIRRTLRFPRDEHVAIHSPHQLEATEPEEERVGIDVKMSMWARRKIREVRPRWNTYDIYGIVWGCKTS